MATVTCGKCGHVRTSDEDRAYPNWQCPSCGVAYSKVTQSHREALAEQEALEKIRASAAKQRLIGSSDAKPAEDAQLQRASPAPTPNYTGPLLLIGAIAAIFLAVLLPEVRGGLILLLGAIIYVLATVIAIPRKHHQQGSIIIVNIFLGWTFLGWVVALAWSASSVRQPT